MAYVSDITRTPLSSNTVERVLQAAGEVAASRQPIPQSRLTVSDAGWHIDGRLADREETRAVDELIQSGHLEVTGSRRVIPTVRGIDWLMSLSAKAGDGQDAETREKFAPRSLPARRAGVGLF